MQDQTMKYPCHIFDIPDAQKAYEDFRGELVKDYGDCVCRQDGSVLHWNYTWDDGGRRLVRCTKCGGLLLMQTSEYHDMFDGPDGYYKDWIPVSSEEEANLLNILLDVNELEDYPCRHFRGNNKNYFWTQEKEPCQWDLEELRKQILKKYQILTLEEVR